MNERFENVCYKIASMTRLLEVPHGESLCNRPSGGPLVVIGPMGDLPPTQAGGRQKEMVNRAIGAVITALQTDPKRRIFQQIAVKYVIPKIAAVSLDAIFEPLPK